MSGLEEVRKNAEQALTIDMRSGVTDSFFWDRSQRLVRNVEFICRLPELEAANLQIDSFCLAVAAYFCDSGVVVLYNKDNGRLKGNGNGEDHLECSAEVVGEKLEGVLEAKKIKKIGMIITESGNRFSQRTEAMILSDARNLDELGAVGIVNELRQYTMLGKNVCDALGIWKRKKEYGYWQARLKEGFRFESVRKIAGQRLSKAESFMEQLKVESVGQDLQ